MAFLKKRIPLFFLTVLLTSLPGHGQDTVISDKIAGQPLASAISSEQEWEDEFKFLEQDLKRYRDGWYNTERLKKEVARPEALYSSDEQSPTDVILKRAEALLEFLKKQNPDDSRVKKAVSDLLAWKTAQGNKSTNRDEELAAFKKLCKIRRSAAFANPLLDFDKILFITHYSQRQGKGEIHMVDQYLGFNAKPGGGIFILENPFSDQAKAEQLFKDISPINGDNKGKPLENGSFLSPELSYDGKTLYFAWTQAKSDIIPENADWSEQNWSFAECRRRPKNYHHYYWAPDRVYHIFSADLETGKLTQLTSGSNNTYDPCELPNGRLAFISEDIGGNQRCGERWLASATLHSMKPDGTDKYPLSYHETNEWQPSVTNDGLIAYTRWDYVDRDNSGAHHMWTTYPDGRDPRSRHGNYSINNNLRPNMELGIRAIPNSRKVVAVAAPHHGTSYGSLLLIDPFVPDDKMMSQVKRITPDALFQEAEHAPGYSHPLEKSRVSTRAEYYGTPWPLSEDFYLCVYAHNQKDYGIYLVDTFGNRELIWKSPDVPCLDPIPFRPRTKPRVIPDQTTQSIDNKPKGTPPATMGEVIVLNVYETEYPLPKGVKAKWLRVVNIFPKTNAYLNEPNIGYGNEALTRGSLGIVPVEEDGSVFFKMPVATNVYFQLLDENKQAFHSMRSSTYIHPGERLSCIGCHENKFNVPANMGTNVPKALSRAASVLQPEPKGSYPITFPRLVQPVLNKNCVACHAKHADKAPPLDGNTFVMKKNDKDNEQKQPNEYGWSNGFRSLYQMGWGKHGGVNSHIRANKTTYSIPGEVGAQASKLLPFLQKNHHGVKLSKEDLYKITLWMDLNTNYYGSYHEEEKQSRGELVLPRLGMPKQLPPGLMTKETK